MRPEEALRELEAFWDLEGFFGRLRMGNFDPAGVDQVERLLASVTVEENAMLPRRS